MSMISTRSWSVRGLGLAMAVTIAACASVPTTGSKPTVRKVTSSPKTASASAKAPSAVPSLGLLMAGRVTVDASALLSSKMAKATATGVKLISDNGLGLISDNGLGLISDNGLGLISDNGLGLISDNGLGLISDNSAGLVSNNSAGLISNNSAGFRIQNVGATASTTVKPVQGMVVTAVNLFTGKVIAGPVATDANGGYKLGFLKAPTSNIGIVASVSTKAPVARFTYATLVPPDDKPVLTDDTTRALTRYLLGVIPGRIQPWIDEVKAGTPDPVDENDGMEEKRVKGLLAKITPARMKEADKARGTVALAISQRIISYLDLKTPAFDEFYDVTEEIRVYSESLQPQPEVSLVEQVMRYAQSKEQSRLLPELFISYGMPEARAHTLAETLRTKVDVIGQQLILVMVVHQKEVFAPLEELADKP
jgi:hypothetical protein